MRHTWLLLVSLSLVACSSGKNNNGTDGGSDTGPVPEEAGADSYVPWGDARPDQVLFTDGPLADAPAQTATIKQITSNQIPAGATVSLSGVTVTAVDSNGPYTGDVYVQDGTGAGSGLRLYTPQRGDGGQIADLKVGDSIRVVGEVKDYAPAAGFPNGKTIKELVNGTITVLGAGSPPSPTIVTASALTTAPTAEGWEHVLVQVKDVKVTKAVNSYGEFEVTGGLSVDDELYGHSPLVGDCLTLTGISSYFYFYKLQPRTAMDVQSSTGCAGPVVVGIKDIQDETRPNHPAVSSEVTVTGVVTAVDSTKNSYGDYEGFYIQDAAGGTHSGIYVYHKWNDASAQKPAAGELVELTGTYEEYGNTSGTVSELTNVSWTVKGTATVPAPIVVSAADMAAGGATAEAHEGVLIEVNNITVGSYFTDGGGVQIGFADGVTGFLVIHKLYDFMNPAPAISTTYSKIVGPLHFAVGTFEVMPRSAADMVTP